MTTGSASANAFLNIDECIFEDAPGDGVLIQGTWVSRISRVHTLLNGGRGIHVDGVDLFGTSTHLEAVYAIANAGAGISLLSDFISPGRRISSWMPTTHGERGSRECCTITRPAYRPELPPPTGRDSSPRVVTSLPSAPHFT